MSKEYLEAIEEIGNIDLGNNPYKTFERNKLKNVYNKEFGTINQALQRLESIDNAEPSEALYKLERLDDLFYLHDLENWFNIIKQALLKAQEQEKENAGYAGGRSFDKEIIYLKQSIEQCNDKPIFYVSRRFGNKYIVPQDKYVQLQNKSQEQEKVLKIIFEKNVDIDFLKSADTFEEYNKLIKVTFAIELTQEEFNLLKRYFKNGKNL